MPTTRKILVVGSNSFSGSYFIDLLLEDRGNDVVGISRSPEYNPIFLSYKRHRQPNFKFYQLDLNRDMPQIDQLLDAFQPDYVVNFAAQGEVSTSWSNPAQWFQTNAVAMTEFAQVLNKKKFLKKYVHISTPEVYGACKGNVKEDAPLNPSTPYAASKAAGDLSLLTFYKNFNFPLVIVRSTNVYGAHQQLYRIIPKTCKFIKMGKKIGLQGAGEAVKSYIHVRDVSRADLAVMEQGRMGEVYHFSPDEHHKVKEIVRLVCEKMGANFDQVTEIVPDRVGQDPYYVIDSSKARNELGWRPQVRLDNGIEEVIRWINQEWATIHREPHEYSHKP